MYINRTLEKHIKQLSNQFKVILVTGARQVGKSTLLKHCVPERNYVTLDDYRVREMALNDPELFLQRYKAPLIIDEIQYAPSILSYIKIAVDNSDKKGQYWLTGSQQFHMMKNVTESLAGRVAIVDLKGLSLKELDGLEQVPFIPTADNIESMRKSSKYHDLTDIYEKIWRGSYPEVNTNTDTDWETFYKSYLRTYIERDIKDLNAVKNEMDFIKFLKVLAARTGQMLDYTDISKEVGVSSPTIKSWVSILVSSNIVYLLQPYFSNINKRIVKTPKIYFMDTGLCSYLTNWDNSQVLENGAISGAIFETYVVSEIIKSYVHNIKEPNIYYYRDKDKREIDVIIERNGKLYPIEIKKSSNPDKSAIKNFSVISEDNLGNGAVVCLAKEDYPITKNINAIPISYI
ncbi:MAG: ATP-binding protein [Candidatus Gastranaerophilaceae bacterium]